MTQQEQPRGVPVWVSAIVILLCVAGGTAFVWWFLSGESPVTSNVALKPTISPQLLQQFHDAVARQDMQKAGELLTAHPELATARLQDGEQSTLLHQMAFQGNTAAAALLLERGADIEARDAMYDGTPLGWAIVAGQPAMVELLLDRGAILVEGMTDMALGALFGAFDFVPAPPADREAILNLLLARGGRLTNPAEMAFLFALNDQVGRFGTPDPQPIDPSLLPAGASPQLRSMLVAGLEAGRSDEGITLRHDTHNAGLVTPQAHTVPVRIRAQVKTDSTNVRLYFGRGIIILNWEMIPTQLRYHEPVTGMVEGIDGQGEITPNEWHTVEWTIWPTHTELMVDGEQRLRREGIFANLTGRVGIGPAWGSTVTVRSLEIDKP